MYRSAHTPEWRLYVSTERVAVCSVACSTSVEAEAAAKQCAPSPTHARAVADGGRSPLSPRSMHASHCAPSGHAVAVVDLRFPGRSDMLGTLDAATYVDVHNLIARLSADVFRSRLRLREFFKDFDPLRAGVVTQAKFRTALDASGLKLTDPELSSLTHHFADPSDPTRVRYEGLLDQIEAVFTTSGMEMDPASTVADFTPQLSKPRIALLPEEQVALDTLIAKLSHIVKVRQLLIRPTFSDYQHNVNSPIQVRPSACERAMTRRRAERAGGRALPRSSAVGARCHRSGRRPTARRRWTR